MSHEINNSLAPIASIADSLARLQALEHRPDDWESDLRSALTTICSRADSLRRFMAAYARLARLPAPSPRDVDVRTLVQGTVALAPRVHVMVCEGPDLVVSEAHGGRLILNNRDDRPGCVAVLSLPC